MMDFRIHIISWVYLCKV